MRSVGRARKEQAVKQGCMIRPRTTLPSCAILSVLLVASACGTRARAEKQAASDVAVAQPSGGAEVATVPSSVVEGTARNASSAPEVPTAPNDTVRTPAVVPAGQTSAAAGSGTGQATGRPIPKAAPASAGASSPGANPKSGAAPAPSPVVTEPSVPAPASANRPPIAIGSVGSYSGPAASSALPGLEGLQFWVRSVNAQGGVQGHQVKLFVGDDGGDSARHRALVQELVERRGVIAFVQQTGAIGGEPSVGYLTEKRVPVINGDGAGDWYYKSPVFFPIAPHGEEFIKASLHHAGDYAKEKNIRKFGLLVCTEAQVCTDTVRLNGNAERARAVGLELVYTGRTSLAQPDFTAECIAARNAGVQILEIVLDSNSVSRIAASCARQGYRPLYLVIGGIAVDTMKDNPNLDGLADTSYAFPYFLCDGVARQYCDALRQFGPARGLGVGTSNGWTAGKAFERAAQKVGHGDVTSEQILEGMWSYKDETLGGLAHPLTFTKDQNAPRRVCWWPLVVVNRQFTAPDGMRVRCVN